MTYVTIAASVLLLYESQTKESSETSNMGLIGRAVEILDVMDESVVARNAAEVIRRFVREFNAEPGGPPVNFAGVESTPTAAVQTPPPGPWGSLEVGCQV